MSDPVRRPRRLTVSMSLNVLLGLACIVLGIWAYSDWALAGVIFAGAGLPMIVGAVGLLRGRRGAQFWAMLGFGILGATNGLLGLLFAIGLATGFGNPGPYIYSATVFMLTLAAVAGYSVVVVRGEDTRRFLWAKAEADIPPEPWEIEAQQAAEAERKAAVEEEKERVILDYYYDPRTDRESEAEGEEASAEVGQSAAQPKQ